MILNERTGKKQVEMKENNYTECRKIIDSIQPLNQHLPKDSVFLSAESLSMFNWMYVCGCNFFGKCPIFFFFSHTKFNDVLSTHKTQTHKRKPRSRADWVAWVIGLLISLFFLLLLFVYILVLLENLFGDHENFRTAVSRRWLYLNNWIFNEFFSSFEFLADFSVSFFSHNFGF